MFDRKLAKIRLHVVDSCNARCGYCSFPYLSRFKYNEGFSSEYGRIDNDELIEFFRDGMNSVPFELYLFGGEPLINWENIKVFFERFCSLPEYKKGAARVVISCNGLLLTDEIVDFVNRYGIYLMFSYDAFNSNNIKGIDVGERHFELFRKTKPELGFINNVIYTKNASIVKADIKLKKMFPGRHIEHSFIFGEECLPATLWRFSDMQVEKMVVELKSYLAGHPDKDLYEKFVASVFDEPSLNNVAYMNIVNGRIKNKNGRYIADISMGFDEALRLCNDFSRKVILGCCSRCENLGYCKNFPGVILQNNDSGNPICFLEKQWCYFTRKHYKGILW